jgi:hypothetical protein
MVPSLQISKTESSAPQMNPCLLERFPCGVAEERKVSRRSLQHQENTNLKMENLFPSSVEKKKIEGNNPLLVFLHSSGSSSPFVRSWTKIPISYNLGNHISKLFPKEFRMYRISKLLIMTD